LGINEEVKEKYEEKGGSLFTCESEEKKSWTRAHFEKSGAP
jgi:hypothetical protein